MIVAGMLSWWVIMVWLVFPLTVKNIRMMLKWKTEGVSSYARLDEGSAQLQLAFSVLLSIGLVVGNYLN
jgi:1,4-dihydroxy-2-naphthoate octaprenyltransferase